MALPNTSDMEYVGGSRRDDQEGPGANRAPDPKAKRKREIAAGVFACLAVLLLLRTACRSSDPERSYKADASIMQVSATVLGAHMRDTGTATKALILTRPSRSAEYVKQVVKSARKGLKKGFGKELAVAGTAEPEFTEQIAVRISGKPLSELPDLSKWLPPLGYWFDAEVLRAVAQKHPDCDVIVSLVGLPLTEDGAPALGLERFGKGTLPKLAVLDGSLPDMETLGSLMASGTVVAAVAPVPCGASAYPESAPELFRSKFEATRCLLTLRNVSDAAKLCPALNRLKNVLKE